MPIVTYYTRTDAGNRHVVHLAAKLDVAICGARVCNDAPSVIVHGDSRAVCRQCVAIRKAEIAREKHIELALLAGWTTDNGGVSFRHPDDAFCQANQSGSVGIGLVPNYPCNLDAFAELVKKLDENVRREYRLQVLLMFGGDEYKAIDAGVGTRVEALLKAAGVFVLMFS